MATHSEFCATNFNSCQDSSVYDFASCGWIPYKNNKKFNTTVNTLFTQILPAVEYNIPG